MNKVKTPGILLMRTAILGLVAVARLPAADAHRDLLRGRLSGLTAEYTNMSSALESPWLAKSFAVNRIATCDTPIFWLKFDAPSSSLGFPLYVGAGIPRLARLADTRIAAVVVGPGMPEFTEAASVPAEVAVEVAGSGMGAAFYPSAVDQTTCDYMATFNGVDMVMKNATSTVLGRCNFYEDYGQSNSWPSLDLLLNATNAAPTGSWDTYYAGFWVYDVNGPTTQVRYAATAFTARARSLAATWARRSLRVPSS